MKLFWRLWVVWSFPDVIWKPWDDPLTLAQALYDEVIETWDATPDVFAEYETTGFTGEELINVLWDISFVWNTFTLTEWAAAIAYAEEQEELRRAALYTLVSEPDETDTDNPAILNTETWEPLLPETT